MANLVGIVKQISGEVVAKDEKGSERKLHLGDEIILGDNILVPDAKSKIVITMTDGQEVMLVGEDTLAFDQNFLNSQGISNVFANNGDLSALQKAILEGKDLNDLEATAAGGGTTSSSEGASLNSDSFTKSGHISNVSEGYGNLSDNNTDSRS
ncbi:retention module-containing protein, partial [Campylobacter sp.]|uniref:retention module-containing protein n=1 Tax=Campylobacter sp. TaxID=205 RepID=UPI00270B6A67|nr:retention module-containing protein [Campylobacter sp.]